MPLVLRQLREGDEGAFLKGLQEWEGESLDWYTFIWKPGMPFSEMLTLLGKESAGIDLAPGRVPHSMLYGFLDGEIVGRVSVRHELNEALRKRGGNLGYSVAPKFRGKGYATEMVAQALDFCRKLGLKSILVTCTDDNVPSWKIIEHFKGQLENRIMDDGHKTIVRRYWISLADA